MSTWDCPLDTLAGPSPSKGLPLLFSFPLHTQSAGVGLQMPGQVAHPKAWAEEDPLSSRQDHPLRASRSLLTSLELRAPGPGQSQAEGRQVGQQQPHGGQKEGRAERPGQGPGLICPAEPPEGGEGRRVRDGWGAPQVIRKTAVGAPRARWGNIDSGYLGFIFYCSGRAGRARDAAPSTRCSTIYPIPAHTQGGPPFLLLLDQPGARGPAGSLSQQTARFPRPHLTHPAPPAQ